MEIPKLEKNLVFYNPGRSGVIFTYQAGHAADSQMIERAIGQLEYETDCEVECVEERRAMPRNF